MLTRANAVGFWMAAFGVEMKAMVEDEEDAIRRKPAQRALEPAIVRNIVTSSVCLFR